MSNELTSSAEQVIDAVERRIGDTLTRAEADALSTIIAETNTPEVLTALDAALPDAAPLPDETPVTLAEKKLPLICVDCHKFFEDKEVVEEIVNARTRDKTKVTRLKTAQEQAYAHGNGLDTKASKGPGTPGVSTIPNQHTVVSVTAAAWDRGDYAEWYNAQKGK